jgi:hypothetical protein
MNTTHKAFHAHRSSKSMGWSQIQPVRVETTGGNWQPLRTVLVPCDVQARIDEYRAIPSRRD